MKISDIDPTIMEGPATAKLCKSSRSNKSLGASALASCKSQGYRRREGKKYHASIGTTVGGKRIKGKKYGGPLPDYGTRKGQ